MNKVKEKILSTIGVILCVLLVPILTVNIIFIIKGFTSDSVPTVGKYFPMIVLTGSMEPEISSGDLIICKSVDPTTIKKGDIVTFYDPDGNGTTVVTHRINEVITNSDGTVSYQTKGDANNTVDASYISCDDVVGVFLYAIPGLGSIALWMQTTTGLIVCVVFPIVLFVGIDVIRRGKSDRQNDKEKEELLAEIEKLKAQNKDTDN